MYLVKVVYDSYVENFSFERNSRSTQTVLTDILVWTLKCHFVPVITYKEFDKKILKFLRTGKHDDVLEIVSVLHKVSGPLKLFLYDNEAMSKKEEE